ncbi:HesA/MoeB/ThiF family protein [Sulfurospirillum arcachonense]|uniref:HesA/MoeB/ThiF family protein n=1 Tax=Sulfurospirillum arcachonense TaxID=57666 RepID=UPI00046A4E69|nr:HesA/MoeB/ThiF family protein [Sulfurospirillum arcachonense]
MPITIENNIQKNSIEKFLPLKIEMQLQQQYNISFKQIEQIALNLGITPLRYKRNQSTINTKSQLKLLNSHIAIIGSGGLGGHIAEILTRIGIGELSIFDFDIFEEHNLNRQNFSNLESLGKEKVTVVKEGLEKINPALHVNAYVHKFDPINDFKMIQNVDVVIDALDNPQTKLELAKICKENKISFIHGAIAGMNGQFTTCNTLDKLYRDGSSGIEKSIGNPSFSVTFAASIQSAEAIKVLLNIGEPLKEKILISNLLENEFIIL